MAVAAIAEIHGVVETDFVGQDSSEGAALEYHASAHRYSFILGHDLIIILAFVIDGLIGALTRFVIEHVQR